MTRLIITEYPNVSSQYGELATHSSWWELCARFKMFSCQTIPNKEAGKLYSPGNYGDNIRRIKSTTGVEASVLALDYDEEKISVASVMKQLKGVNYLIHTTASNKANLFRGNKFRLLVPIETVGVETYHKALVGLSLFLGIQPDRTKLNMCSLFYYPYQIEGSKSYLHFEAGCQNVPIGFWLEFYSAPPPKPTPVVKPKDIFLQPYNGTLDITQTVLVEENIMKEYIYAPVGRRFYRFMTQVALKALGKGWFLTPEQLLDMALQMSRAVDPNKERPGALGEAAAAIEWAIDTFEENQLYNDNPLKR